MWRAQVLCPQAHAQLGDVGADRAPLGRGSCLDGQREVGVFDAVHLVHAGEIAGRILRLEVGQEVMLPAGVRHTVRNVGGTSARWLYGYRIPGFTG